MSALTRIGALVGGCALALSVQACSGDTGKPAAGGSTPPASAEPASPAPAESALAESAPAEATPAGTKPPRSVPARPAPTETTATLRANRQFVFATAQSRGTSMLTVTSSGVLGLTEEFSDRALFVPVPLQPGGDAYLLKTGKLRSGGEAYCLMVVSGGRGNPLQVKTAACDAGERDQRFTFPDGPEGNQLLMEVAGLYVHQWSDGDKIVAEESGEGDNLTAFTLTDRGKAAIPALD